MLIEPTLRSDLLAGQVAIVTGGSRGIGGATSETLVANGAHVVIADVDETVTSSGMRRATAFCISAKAYQRRTSGLRHHGAAATSTTRSRVIG